MSPESTTEPTDQDDTTEVVAYLFNDRNRWGKWQSRILEFHPEEITDNKFKNVVRLTTHDMVEYNDPPQVATKHTQDSQLTEGLSEGVSIGIITKDMMETVVETQPLVPIKDDLNVDFTPAPVRESSACAYFRQNNTDDEVYYRVFQSENEAERLVVNETGYDLTRDQSIREIWLLENQGAVTEVSYHQTAFSNPVNRCFDDTPFDLADSPLSE